MSMENLFIQYYSSQVFVWSSRVVSHEAFGGEQAVGLVQPYPSVSVWPCSIILVFRSHVRHNNTWEVGDYGRGARGDGATLYRTLGPRDEKCVSVRLVFLPSFVVDLPPGKKQATGNLVSS